MRSAEVLPGLLDTPKSVASKFLYDSRGSRLFDEICGLEDYYPARVESGILSRYAEEIGGRLGRDVRLIEPGAGTGWKTEILLDHLEAPAEWVPIDVSRAALDQAARRIAGRFPFLPIRPVWGDFARSMALPRGRGRRGVVFFPGSTLGNFHPWEAVDLLRSFARAAGPGGAALVGVDLKKEPEIIERAYNDRDGVTAEFNLNLLRRLNRELGADFQPRAFRHRAFYDETRGRIEMHLVAGSPQRVRLDGHLIAFERGESVRTEVAYKYEPEEFARLCEAAGLEIERRWSDDRDWFGLFLCVPRGP
ncbi:MAG TPA: L-histidine N(alpha)-methyltransferase [Planctomycetota bacterium]